MVSAYSAKKRNLARKRYKALVGIETVSARVYHAGWDQGEWTCCRCGLVIGKQIVQTYPFHEETRSIPSYGAAGKHSLECGEKDGSF